MTSARAGQPAAPSDLVDVAETGDRLLRRASRPGRSRAAGGVRHLRPPRLGVHARRSTRTTSPPSPRPSASTGAARAPPGRCSSAGHPRAVRARAATALEVLAANGVHVLVTPRGGYTPTPALSHAILAYNRGRTGAGRRHRGHAVAQPARGRRLQVQPAGRRPGRHRITAVDPDRANELLAGGLREVQRVSATQARGRGTHRSVTTSSARTSRDLGRVVDLDVIAGAGIRIGADPLGGASVAYWGAIAERYGLDLTVVNPTWSIRRSGS